MCGLQGLTSALCNSEFASFGNLSRNLIVSLFFFEEMGENGLYLTSIVIQVLLPISSCGTNVISCGAFYWRPAVFWERTNAAVSQTRCCCQGLESTAEGANTATVASGEERSPHSASVIFIASGFFLLLLFVVFFKHVLFFDR